MTPQALALQWGLIVWLAIFAAMLAFRFLARRIVTTGLLSDRRDEQGRPDRLQMLVITLAAAATYCALAVEAKAFPEVPDWGLALVGGSQSVYLFGKGLRA